VTDYAPTVALLRRIRMDSLAGAQELFLAWAEALRGRTPDPLSLDQEGFDERAYAAAFADNGFCMTYLYAARLHLGVLFGDPRRALEAARTARSEAWVPHGVIWPVFLDFWSALALAALADAAGQDERRAAMEEIAGIRDSLATLAGSCPENFLCQERI